MVRVKAAVVALVASCNLIAASFQPGELIGAGFGPSWIGGTSDPKSGEPLSAKANAADLMENIGSKKDGAGMCVDTSIESNAIYLGMEEYRGFRDYFAQTEGGGNYPGGVDRQLKTWCKMKGLPAPKYVQYEGASPEQVLAIAAKTRRGCAIAYGYSPRYGQAINHMVFCPHYGDKAAAIADNNVFGGLTRDEAKRYEWMEPRELVNRMSTQADRFGRATRSDCWVFVWLEPAPPRSPFN